MLTELASRPVPSRRLPLVSGTALVLLALPLFLLVGWPVRGWAFGLLLWVGSALLELLFARIGIAGQPSLRGSGVVAFGMMTRGILVMILGFVVAVSAPEVAVAGVLVYAAAYTLELIVFLATFTSAGERQ
jgi:hypothetical protein